VKRLAFLVLLAACERPPAPPSGIPVVDSRGKTVLVPARPERIVSLAPSTTELLFAVGAGGQVAGVTSYCDFPEAAKGKPQVGNIILDWEKLATVRPDLVLAAPSISKKACADLEAKGYAVFGVDPSSFEEIAKALERVGQLAGHGEEGRRAAGELRARVAKVRAVPGPTFYFEHSCDPLGTTGPESYAGEALRLAGGRNIVEGGWKSLDWETVMSKDPEVILIAHDRKDGLERRAGWKELRAVKTGRVHFVAKEHFVYPTPRLADGLEEAARIFHAKDP